jgi:hypothetical protein
MKYRFSMGMAKKILCLEDALLTLIFFLCKMLWQLNNHWGLSKADDDEVVEISYVEDAFVEILK